MATADIVARLRLEGEDFSRDFRTRMSGIEAQARETANALGGAFTGAGTRIKSAADSFLAFERGAEQANRLRASVDPLFAAQLRYNQAMDLANDLQAQGVLTGQRYMQVLDGLNAEFQRSIGVQDTLNAVRARGGMVAVQASQQFQDFFIQVGGGQSIMVAATQQLSQLAFVMQNAGGASSRFAQIISGPWGAAILGGTMVLGMLIPKLIGTGDATERATREIEENARKTEANREAQAAFANTLDGVTTALQANRAALNEMDDAHKSAARRALESALASQIRMRTIRAETEALINQAAAEAEVARLTAGAGDAGVAWVAETEQRLAQLRAQLAQARANEAESERQVRDTAARLAVEIATQSPEDRRARDRRVEIDHLRQRLVAERATTEEIVRQVSAVQARHRAEDEAEERRRRRRPSAGAEANAAGASATLAQARRYLGLDERTPGERNQLMELFRQANLNVDPAMVAWCAAFVNAVLATQGLRGTGSLGARSFLNWGAATQNPNPGDIVVLRRGNDPSEGHVGFYQGRTADGRIRVLGGNQGPGGAVTETTFASRDVLGYRRASAASEQRAANDLQQEEERRQRILATMEAQTAEMVEQASLSGLRLQGLDREAQLAERIADRRRDYEERLRDFRENGATAEQVAAQEQVTPALTEQLRLYEQQNEAVARLVARHGENEKLTKDERAEIEAALAVRNRTLTAAEALATTLAGNFALQSAIVRGEERNNVAIEEGNEALRRRNEIRDKEAEIRRSDEEEQQRQLDDMKQDMMRREEDQLRELADLYRDLFSGNTDDIIDRFKDGMLDAIAQIAAAWTLAQISGQRFDLGATMGQMGASGNPIAMLLSSLGGGGGVGKGAAAGGAMGLGPGLGILGIAAGAAGLGSLLGLNPKTSGTFGVVPAALHKLLSGTSRGSATLGFVDGDFGVGSTRGNSRNFIAASSGAMESVSASLDRIAEMLGGSITGAGSVSLGQRDGKWRGDPSGRGITKTKKGAIDFGDDQEAAIRWAIGEALRDGVIGGISDAAKKILQSGKDLEKAIDKAVMIEQIPKLLKARLDPVGAALDAHEEKWAKIIAALKEGSATAEQMAEAQQLYKLELEETIARTAGASASLKEFLDGLKMGPNSPYSLRQQEEIAAAALQPFLDKIASGEAIDQDKYQATAQQYLDIERQLYGSTDRFFSAMDTIMAATGKAIDRIDSAVPIRTAVDPFVEQTAANTGTMTEQLGGLQEQVAAQGSTLTAILQVLQTNGGGAFIGAATGFVKAA